jgi:hypothetical protein
VHVLSVPQFMLPAHFDGFDHGAQIYGAQRIPDPPDHSAFNLGGGGVSGIGNKTCAHMDGPETSIQINDPDLIMDPPIRSSFNGRGGVRNE